MAELKTLTIDGVSTNIDAGDYVRYDANGIYLPITISEGSKAASNLPHNAMTNYSLFTVPATGVYWVVANAEFSANATGSRYFQFRIDNPSSSLGGICRTSAAPTGITTYTISAARHLSQGYAISARCYQNSGSAITVSFSWQLIKIEE